MKIKKTIGLPAKPLVVSLSLLLLSGSVFGNTPPNAPSSLSVTATAHGSVELKWGVASDDDGEVVGYVITKNNQRISVGNITHYVDREILDGGHYDYSVFAVDNSGAESSTGPVARVSLQTSSASASVSLSSHSNSQQTERVCVDSDGDGHGWDGHNSCVVFSARDNNVSTENCIDDDGDGWGWNGKFSCRITIDQSDSPRPCLDPDGDGWGWDGRNSCKP